MTRSVLVTYKIIHLLEDFKSDFSYSVQQLTIIFN